MPNSDLMNYVQNLQKQGVADDTIRQELIKSGWSATDIDPVFLPVTNVQILPPPPLPRFGMWVSFEYVLLFITLWIWSVALGGIFNFAIDKHIPDAVAGNPNYFSLYSSSMLLQGYLAAILVSYPFFMVLFLAVKDQIEKNPAIRNVKTRKFLIYLTMVVNFIYMLSQLIATIYGYLGANASSRTIPHLIVNLVIPGIICLYLLKEVREDRITKI